MYMTGHVLALIYFVWTILSDETLHKMGIFYYPSKIYATFIPAYLLTLVLLIISLYGGYNLSKSHEYYKLDNIQDCFSVSAVVHDNKFDDTVESACDTKLKGQRSNDCNNVPDIYDIDVIDINKLLILRPQR